MNRIANQDQNKEPEFEPDLAYDLSSHRLPEDGVIDGDSLTAEIKRDLQAFTSKILLNDEQKRTLFIQVTGASLEEEDSISKHIISECQRIDPRIQDIEVQCEDFKGDLQVAGYLGEELAKFGFRASENLSGITQFNLRNYHQAIRFQIHKEEEKELTSDEAQQIADYIAPDIFRAVESWAPGTKLNLHVFSHNTKVMHQDIVEDIFNQVFNVALQKLATTYSAEDSPLIPNIEMHLSFAKETFDNEINKITYKSPKDKEKEQKDDLES